MGLVDPLATVAKVASHEVDQPDSFGIDLEESLLVYHKISDLCADGTDIRDVVSSNFAGVDIRQYVPCDPDSDEHLTLGSIPHLMGDCKRCTFLVKNRCHKGVLCLYCHFPHEEPCPDFRRRASKKNRLRLRRKRAAEKAAQDDVEGPSSFGSTSTACDAQASYPSSQCSDNKPEQPYQAMWSQCTRISI